MSYFDHKLFRPLVISTMNYFDLNLAQKCVDCARYDTIGGRRVVVVVGSGFGSWDSVFGTRAWILGTPYSVLGMYSLITSFTNVWNVARYDTVGSGRRVVGSSPSGVVVGSYMMKMVHSKKSVTRFSVFDTRYSGFGSRYSVFGTRAWILGTPHSVVGMY